MHQLAVVEAFPWETRPSQESKRTVKTGPQTRQRTTVPTTKVSLDFRFRFFPMLIPVQTKRVEIVKYNTGLASDMNMQKNFKETSVNLLTFGRWYSSDEKACKILEVFFR